MATIPVNVPDAEVPRVAEAVGDELGLRNPQGLQRNATLAEVQGLLASDLKAIVRRYETRKTSAAAAAAVTDVSAT